MGYSSCQTTSPACSLHGLLQVTSTCYSRSPPWAAGGEPDASCSSTQSAPTPGAPPSPPSSLTLLITGCISLTSISHRFCTALITLFKIHFQGNITSLTDDHNFGQLWVSFRASCTCTISKSPLLKYCQVHQPSWYVAFLVLTSYLINV